MDGSEKSKLGLEKAMHIADYEKDTLFVYHSKET